VAVAGDDAEPVAVAVEREAELVPALRQQRDEIREVLRPRGIGVVIRERAVDLSTSR